MSVARLAMLSVHTSPLDRLGGEKTGGMNVYVRELAQELGKHGVLVDIFTRKSGLQDEIDTSLGENVRVIYIPCGINILDPADLYAHLPQFVSGVVAFTIRNNLSYDLIYSHYWLSGWVASKLREMWGVPFVQMFHTLGHMKNRILRDPMNAGIRSDLRVQTEMRIAQAANRIIAATPAEQMQLMWLYRVDRRKIEVIPPGVNLERFSQLPMDEAKSHLGLSSDTHLFSFVGRMEPLKGIDTLIEALDHIKKQSPVSAPNLRCVVIGGVPGSREWNRLQHLTRQLGVDSMIEFLGAKDQQLLPYYYAASDAVIMPSDYESFGMVALEAMACGAPVIASEVGGLAYLVRDGVTGYLVPVRDSDALARRILFLMQNPDQRYDMGNMAAKVAEEYTWSAIADQLLKIFDEVALKPVFTRRMH